MFAKVLICKLAFIFLPLVAFANEVLPPSYPVISEWQGQAWVTGKDGKRKEIKSRLVLREKALIETALLGQVKVQLDDLRSFTLLGTSSVSLPIIGWDSGEVPVVILKNGELHWQQEYKSKGSFNVAVRSDLFEFILPSGNYVLSVYPEKAFAGVKVFEGQMEFSSLNGESSVQVQAGQQAGFQGVLEGGEIAYDVLLKGKKIPRGRLLAVSPIDAAEIAKVAKARRKFEQEKALRQKSARDAQDKLKRDGVICEKPPGKFNECAWVCLNNPKKEKKACLVGPGKASCVRRRCNANGVWADEMVLDAEKFSNSCKAQPRVAPCDY